jgi:hypothetical protein
MTDEIRLAAFYALTIATALGVGWHLEEWVNTKRHRHLAAMIGGLVLLAFLLTTVGNFS